MPNRRLLATSLFCLCCHAAGAMAAPSAASQVVHTKSEFEAAIASNSPTPLDALTPYGKRQMIANMAWGERGLGGLSPTPLLRELDHEQLAAVLRFLGVEGLQPGFDRRLIGPPLRLPAPSPAVERDFAQLRRLEDEERARRGDDTSPVTRRSAPAVLQRYEALFGARMQSAALRALPTGDLQPLFDAAGLAANGNPGSRATDDVLRVHGELARRGIDTRRTLDDTVMYALLAARRFDEARSFAAARPQLAGWRIPRLDDPLGPGFQGRSVLAFDAATNTLTRQSLPYPAGFEPVMVVGSGCHFSQDALQAIDTDKALQDRLQRAGLVLIIPPTSPIDLDFVREWNAGHPGLPIRIPYNEKEWQAFDQPATPEFYVLKDGKQVGERLTGWPAEGNHAALTALIEAAGK